MNGWPGCDRIGGMTNTSHLSAGSGPTQQNLLDALQRYWGYNSFRPLQREAMECVLNHRDSVVVLPTGGGKSLCFQAPALCMEGVALVVSPLISLMQDQVETLCECGVDAAYVNSTLSMSEKRLVADRLRRGEIRLLYVSPERLMVDKTLAFLRTLPISLIAIDEAHCISAWGHDFRPEYRELRVLREQFPQVGVHAYTATASPRVRQDIAEQLGLRKPEMLVGSFDRRNLLYRIIRRNQGLQQMFDVLERHRSEAGIVYCITRREVEQTCQVLCESGYRALPYHAGLPDHERQQNQQAFMEERCDVIVATIAFGMGIDKPNVRFVVHNGMPKSLENYQQESGRAGRDGLEAECVLIYSSKDFMTWQRITLDNPAPVEGAKESLEAIWQFCTGVTCRHRALVQHFGQDLHEASCQACDVCLNELDVVSDSLVISQKILSCVIRLNQQYGGEYTAKVLTGSTDAIITERGHGKLSTYGLLSHERKGTVRDWIEQLVGQEFLRKEGEYNVLQVTQTGRQLLKGQGQVQLLRPVPKTNERRATPTLDSWDGVDRGLFDDLRVLRRAEAVARNLAPYMVFDDATLREFARRRPSSLTALHAIRGVGEKKLKEFGECFLQRIAVYCRSNQLALDVPVVPSIPDSGLRSRAETNETIASSSAPRVGEAGRSITDPPASSTTPRRAPVLQNPTTLAAFKAFDAGRMIEEVCRELDRAVSTVYQYLYDYILERGVVDPTRWVAVETVNRVEQAIDLVGMERLKPIYEHLNQSVSYEEIRIVTRCREVRMAQQAVTAAVLPEESPASCTVPAKSWG